MITLPNGDKWIIDDRELEGVPTEQWRVGNLPATTIEDFLKELLDESEDHPFRLPRKLTPSMGGYWDANFNPYHEVLGGIAINIVKTDFFSAYEMADGKVYVAYMDMDCYDAVTKVKIYPSRKEYADDVNFES